MATVPRHFATATLGRFLCVMVAVVLACTMMGDPADAAKKSRKKTPPVDRYASIVIEASTGYILSEKNPDRRLYPASLTKMMTLYLAFEALDNGTLRKYDRIPVSKRAAFQEPSELGVAAGSSLKVEDAILGLVTKSANDAAVVLAEKIGGSEPRFAAMMNRKALSLGMKGTHFVNASGLHDSSQYSSARDMAILGQALIRDFPQHYRYFSTNSFTYSGRTYSNHNHLMRSYTGMDGIKTGYVYASGYNLVASAQRGGVRLIGVVFGGRTSKSRNSNMAQLLDAGFLKVGDARVASMIAKRKAAGSVMTAAASIPVAQTSSGTRPLPKPSSLTNTSQAAAKTQLASFAPSKDPVFNAMSLIDDEAEGDADEIPMDVSENHAVNIADTKDMVTEKSFVKDFKPRPLNTTTIEAARVPTASAARGGGNWAVQVGAFSSHQSGMAALKSAHDKLPMHISGGSQYMIAPLMTNRGMIYRARLSGLGRDQATQACHVLQ